MGKRGPKPGTMLTRPRDAEGRYIPVSEPIKSWSKERVLAAIAAKYGLKTLVCQEIGCSLDTLANYSKQFPEIDAALLLQHERVNDLAELSLISGIINREPWAVIWRLKTQAKDRGYIETVRQEQTGIGGGPIQVQSVELHLVALLERLATPTLALPEGDAVQQEKAL